MISLQKKKFPVNALNGDLVNCQNIEELKNELERNSSRVIIFSCYHSQLRRLKSIFQQDYNIKTVFIRTNVEEILFPVSLFASRNIEFIPIRPNKKQLFKHFCIKAMEHYFQQGLTNQMNENQGLANLYFRQATNAAQQLEELTQQ